jgi:vacuolar-type H+-ATPase subunit F/Vma7
VNKSVAVICTPGVAPGFNLAGITARTCASGAQAAPRIDELAAESAGVIFVEDRLYDDLPGEARRQMQRRILPVILPFPGPTGLGGITATDYVVELLRRAIGYRVNLR